jgi:hypothetical protein
LLSTSRLRQPVSFSPLGQIALSGGVTADRMIFNFPGTGGVLNIFKNDTVMRGTLLIPPVIVYRV